MVRGTSKVVSWCRLLVRQQRDSISRGGGSHSHTGRFSTVADVTEVGSQSSDNEVSVDSPPRRNETLAGEGFRKSTPPISDLEKFLFGLDEADSSSSKEVPVNVAASPASGPFYPASQSSEPPQPRIRNDRYFRSRNNSAVANLLKLLEAAANHDEVEKILEEQIPDLSVSSRWPWLALLEALHRGPKAYLALEVSPTILPPSLSLLTFQAPHSDEFADNLAQLLELLNVLLKPGFCLDSDVDAFHFRSRMRTRLVNLGHYSSEFRLWRMCQYFCI